MKKIYVVFGLHAYQPPTQTKEIVEEIVEQSYGPLAELLLKSPAGTVACADIPLSLIELLKKFGQKETITLIGECVKKGKIQLVNTAAYHPILPLVPDEYAERQLKLNLGAYADYFGVDPGSVKGIFPPEMAFSERILGPIKKSGAIWTITDDKPFCSRHGTPPPHNEIIKRGGVAIFLMSHLWQPKIAFGEIPNGGDFLRALENDFGGWAGSGDSYIVFWMDWETFGHHDRKPNPPQDRLNDFLKVFFEEIERSEVFRLTTPEKLMTRFPPKDIFVPDGSWSTSGDDCRRGIPYPLWLHPENEFHQLMKHLSGLVLSLFHETENGETKKLLDRCLYSCQMWQWSYGNREIAKKGLEIFKEIFSRKDVPDGIKREGWELVRRIENLP